MCIRRQRRLLDARSKVFQVPVISAELAAAFSEFGSRHCSAYRFLCLTFCWTLKGTSFYLKHPIRTVFDFSPKTFKKPTFQSDPHYSRATEYYFPERPRVSLFSRSSKSKQSIICNHRNGNTLVWNHSKFLNWQIQQTAKHYERCWQNCHFNSAYRPEKLIFFCQKENSFCHCCQDTLQMNSKYQQIIHVRESN